MYCRESLAASLTNHLVMDPIHAFVWKMGAEFDACGRESACMRRQDTGIGVHKEKNKNKKANDCKYKRLILHRGHSGTYLSQQGEPGEG